MNARAREREAIWRLAELIRQAGRAGERYSAGAVAAMLGVPTGEVTSWIRNGWLRASRYEDAKGVRYAIKRSAIRRAIMDVPQVQKAILRAFTTASGRSSA